MRAHLLISLLLTATLSAQQPPSPDQSPSPYTLRSTSNLVLVPTEVETHHGDLLYTLRPDQFVLLDNGVPQTIHLDDDPGSQGLSLVVVVQCSRSAFRDFAAMRGLPAMVDSLAGGAPHQIALVSYGTEIELLAPLTGSENQLAKGYANLQPCDDEKNAVTLDAVDYARNLLEAVPASSLNRRAILLIGETRDHGSHIKPAEVIANLGRANTVVDAVSFTPGTQDLFALLRGDAPNPREAILLVINALRRNIPSTLAGITGGIFTTFNSQKGFERRVQRLSNRIHNYYLLSFQPAGAEGAQVTAGLHHLSIKVPDYPDARLRYRLTYYAGQAPPPDLPDSAEPSAETPPSTPPAAPPK